jgi:methyltransferase (TIGR00027 family)
MRPARPSFTAAAVALARGIAAATSAVPNAPLDPLARELLPLPLALLGRAIERTAPLGRSVGRAWNVASLGLVDHMALRTAAIDDALRVGLADGDEQLVILGAGLDARAFRMPELGNVVVYEVDHPATQAYKRARIGQHPPLAKELRFVEVDFEKTSLAGALAGAGQRTDRKTFWIWEGVTMYLPLAATRATLEAVAARSCAGSRLAMTYVPPVTPGIAKVPAFFAMLGMRLIGEPMVGRMPVDRAHEELARAGFRVLSDESSEDWLRRYGDGQRRLLLPSRLVVAQKGPRP